MPVYPELTGEAYLSYLGRLGADPPDPDTVLRLLSRFQIDASGRKRRMRELSHGMKRKFGIVSALMARPRVAILDEPTSGLDPLMIEAFAETVAELKREGRTTVFLSSHVLSEVERTCDRVAVIRDGRLAAVETIAGIRRRAAAPGDRAPRTSRCRRAARRARRARRPRGIARRRALGAGGVRPDGAAAGATARLAG